MAEEEAVALPSVQARADRRAVDSQSTGYLGQREPRVEAAEPEHLISGQLAKDAEIERVHCLRQSTACRKDVLPNGCAPLNESDDCAATLPIS